jgi:hypothetical protein
MISPSNDPNTTRTRTQATGRAPLVATRVRLIPRPAADRPAPRFPRTAAEHPASRVPRTARTARTARTTRVDTRFRVDGRPVVVHIERPRYRIGRGALIVTGIAAPIVAAIAAVAWLIASAVAWVVDNLALLLGGGVALVVVLAALSRSGVACVGIHCPGCGHR